MTSRRAYVVLGVLLGLGAMTVFGMLTSARREGSLHEFNWGAQVQIRGSRGVVNRVRVVTPFHAAEDGFSYYTGAHSPGSGQPSEAPERVIAEGMHGAVAVRLLAFDPYTRERGGDDAAEIARSVSLATTRVWPGQPIPVRMDVHFMPDDVPFSQAKRVDWREGDAYALALLQREGPLQSETPAHELYHVLAGRWSLGNNDPAANRARPRAANAYEEAAAALFASCARLLATGSLARDTRDAVFVIADETSQRAGEQRFEGGLDGEELARALELLRQEEPAAQWLGPFLAQTVLAEVFGDAESIALESPQGERLVARCREAAANPMRLSFRLAELLGAAGQQPESRALDD
jgi:hypothetical protein